MDLVERYVNDVGRRLPRKQRAEVRRELRSSLLDAIDEAGGEPDEASIVEALTRLGSPEAVAASYRPADQYLIGPELYPDFKRVLGITMAILLSLLVAAFALSFLSRPAESPELGRLLLGWIGGLFDAVWVVFAIVVLIFAALQRLGVRPSRALRQWDPRQLPVVRDADIAGRGEMAFNVVVAGTALALLHVFKDDLGIVARPGGGPLLNEIVQRYLPWATLALLLSMALHAFLFWRGRWDWPTRFAHLAIDLFGLGVLHRVAAAVAMEKATLESLLPPPVPTVVVQTAWWIFAVVAAFVAWDAGKMLMRAIRGS